jgi:hypothetical protein
VRNQLAHFGRLRNICAVIADAHLEFAGEPFAQRFDRCLVSEAVQHQISARTAQRARYAEADAARRAGDNRYFSFQRSHQVMSSGTFSK